MSRKSLAEQAADQVKLQIASGNLLPGTKLPSLRVYSQLRGIAKNTVVEAYEQLVVEGLVEPRRGSGYYVTGAMGAPLSAESWAPALDHALANIGIDRSAFHAAGGGPSVGEGLPPSSWLSSCRLDRYMQKIGRNGLGSVFRNGDPYGYLPLRQNIARKLQSYGIDVHTHQIILTNGAYQAVDIVIRHFVRQGDVVLVDTPGFYPTFNKLKLQGAQIIGIPRTSEGPDLDYLRHVLKHHSPTLFFTQSTGHNPTGSDISTACANELIQLTTAAGITIVDDDALADFKPTHCVRVPSIDQLASTIYVGSFSKSLSSVVRVGFLACAPELARRLVDVKTILSLNSSPYAERTVNAVISEGRFQRHVLELQQKSKSAAKKAIQLLRERGATVFCTQEHTLYFWVQLPGVQNATEFTKRMLAFGITLAPGSIFLPDSSQPSPWFRFNVGFMEDEARMATIWRESERFNDAA
jgi:DNA-binding transcriptional MocR family regulator